MIARPFRWALILLITGGTAASLADHGQVTASEQPQPQATRGGVPESYRKVWNESPEKPVSRPEAWRGVHVMAWGLAGGPEGLVLLKEAVAKVLAPLGVNVIVLEVGYNYGYQSHPELTQTKFITKADARDLVRFCRARGIRVIPQFNCLGHQSWRHTLYPLLTQYRELEEPPDDAPDKRWTELRSWCPLHPQVNLIVFALMDELIDAFEADAFHVGMDEVLVIASRKCERCRGKTPAEVFAKAVNDYHRHLVGEKKVTMLMWGDRLIDANVIKYDGWSASKIGTASAVDLIPKDIIICDWHYEKRSDYPSVRYFQDKGFRVWPAGWNNVDATRALIACARRNATDRMLGHLSTTWVLEPGGFARAILGEHDPALVSRSAIQAAAACRAAMEEQVQR
jgi:hypothetical protein